MREVDNPMGKQSARYAPGPVVKAKQPALDTDAMQAAAVLVVVPLPMQPVVAQPT
uniref:Uncharacterized protein n=1 Tax=Romanomermis culicivorax TaxID=13658 RepID=A0A915JGS5_ROMCU